MSATFTMRPLGDFDLGAQRGAFGGWPEYTPDPGALAMAFAVEGWTTSAAVVLRQPERATITGTVFGAGGDDAGRAWRQALAVLSLDVDGSGLEAVADRDPLIGELLRQRPPLRPALFHSPYEAACQFIISQRSSIVQARALRARMAQESGDHIDAGGFDAAAFPRPQVLLQLDEVRGLPAEKLRRLQAAARAALDGVLDRERLRALPVEQALALLRSIHGVGQFSAQGILHRGAGLVDEVTDDPVTKEAVQRRYGLGRLPDQEEVLAIAEGWRPYRMWCAVHLHMWVRNDAVGPRRN